ncbi:plasma membrane proteolipid Pmp3 [Salvia divinorum]|uniref:Plasma membrane proteolipid Pmp3 n=1 Tax=Salvia divinorum TaxID=28513 RepID=A0ABD1H6L9_SALDI
MGSETFLEVILAIFLPPVGVFLRYGLGIEFWIDLLLTILGLGFTKETSLPVPVHLLADLHRKIVSGGVPKANHGSVETRKPIHSFLRATDLKEKGFTFNPSPTESLKDVSIACYFFYARIHLPVWADSAHTKVLLKNLVAYELSPNSPTEMEVTSYINLMKLLIDGAEDVKELRERRVLRNMLSCDEEAAAVFTGIDTHGVNNPRLYGDVKEQIDAHCDLSCSTAISDLRGRLLHLLLPPCCLGFRRLSSTTQHIHLRIDRS